MYLLLDSLRLTVLVGLLAGSLAQCTASAADSPSAAQGLGQLLITVAGTELLGQTENPRRRRRNQ